MTRGVGRGAWGVGTALALAAASVAHAQAPLPVIRHPSSVIILDTSYVEAVIQLDIEDGPSAVIPALVRDSVLLLPVRQFFTLAEIRLPSFVLRDSAVAMLEPGSVPLRFRPTSRVLTRGGAPVPFDTLDVIWWDGDLFVATALLDRLIGVVTRVEWADLSAFVGRSGALPVVARARRERRRETLYRPPPAPLALEMPLRARAVDGAVLTWSFTASARGPIEQQSLDLGLGAGLLGGSAELRPQFWNNGYESGVELRGSWMRTFTNARHVRQAGIGDVQSNGRRARLLQGFMLTNAPFIRSSEFDVEQFVGTVPAGWEVELYDGGRLLGYADADALGAFRVPLQLRYGQNPFDLVMYGPGGEQLRQKRTIRVPFSRLPDGHLEYAVAAGRCRYEPCDAMAGADARYGLSSHVTLQGGMDAFFQDTAGSLLQPYAIVSAAPLPAVGVTGEAVINGHLRLAADYEPSSDLHLTAGHTRFSASGLAYSGTMLEETRSEATAFWRPGLMRDALFFRAALVQSNGPGMRRTLERLSATTRVGIMRYGLGLLYDATSRQGAAATRTFTVDASADAILMGPAAWMRSANVSGQLAFEPARGLTALRTAAGRRISRLFRIDGGLGWFRGTGFSMELSVSTSMPGPRFGARSRVSSEAGSEALTYAYGSLAWDPRSRLTRLGDGADLGRAGIRGVLFRDDNGNGSRDPGEPGLANIPIQVGGWPATTDAEGRFSAWGLYPSEPADIQIDSLSFGDPRFILPAAVIRVRPAANSFGLVSVPVVVGGEISGYVVFQDQGLAGVPVVLREMNTGAEISVVTFADGGFYKAAVPPGEYEVTLPDDVLERLRATAPPLSIFVPPGAGEKRFEDLHLRLEPRP